jgi:hypothetical protein
LKLFFWYTLVYHKTVVNKAKHPFTRFMAHDTFFPEYKC